MTDQPDLAAEAAEISRIHDEGRYDQYGEHPAESIGTLLDYIAALTRELEEATQAGIDTAREISDTLTGRIDELEAENELRREALRWALENQCGYENHAFGRRDANGYWISQEPPGHLASVLAKAMEGKS